MTFKPVHLFACSALALAGCDAEHGPDIIFYGGPILTVNSQDQVVQAIAIKNGLISAVGSQALLLKQQDEHTRLYDLQGHTLLPGFIAAHEHPTLTAVMNGAVDLSGFTYQTNAQVWDALRQAVRDTPKGEWIYARGIDPILVPDLRIPNRQELDAIAPDNPVLLTAQSLHSFWANSQAFAAAGITEQTADPGDGAYYQRDEHRQLTGFIAEARAAAPLQAELKSPWKIFGRYQQALDELNANGFTSVASLGFNVPPLMARLASSRHFQPRIRQFFYLIEDELKYLPGSPNNGDEYFRVQGVKLWHDGSPYTGTMYSSAPYLDSPLAKTLGISAHSHGAAMIDQATLQAKLQKYVSAGWQVAIHTQGDASNREVAAAIAQLSPQPAADRPIRIEHAIELPLELMPSLAALKVTPSFHINHILYYGDALNEALIGPAAAQQLLPVRRAFELDMHPTLHADSPMFPANGYSLMATAISRKTSSGASLNPAQAIDVQQALRAMTINGAYQLGIAEQVGSLEVGKWADLQIVANNPYSTPTEQLAQTRVLAVYLAGRQQVGADQ